MKLYKLQKLQQKRQFVAGRLIIGIDPAKASHEAQILDVDGLPLGSSFSFAATFTGFNERLWRGLQSRLPATLAELPRHKLVDHLVFAVEASCNLWPTLVDYLEAQHYRVVMASPLSTCHARPAKSMASETSKYVPEIRAKYLRRRLAGHVNRQKNLVAVMPQLLALLIALMREGRRYEEGAETVAEVERLEAVLARRKKQRRRSPGRTAA